MKLKNALIVMYYYTGPLQGQFTFIQFFFLILLLFSVLFASVFVRNSPAQTSSFS